MTSVVTLKLPDGRPRVYRVGQRVRIKSGCPQLKGRPEYDTGCEAVVYTMCPGGDIAASVSGHVLDRLIPPESLYLEPLDGVAA